MGHSETSNSGKTFLFLGLGGQVSPRRAGALEDPPQMSFPWQGQKQPKAGREWRVNALPLIPWVRQASETSPSGSRGAGSHLRVKASLNFVLDCACLTKVRSPGSHIGQSQQGHPQGRLGDALHGAQPPGAQDRPQKGREWILGVGESHRESQAPQFCRSWHQIFKS